MDDPEITQIAAQRAKRLDAASLSRSTDLTQADLVLISKIESLESIAFIGGQFESYEPLAALPLLTKLAINHWSDEDLSSVGSIVQLRELDLGENEQYTNIQFVSKLKNLESIRFTDGQFSDLSPLAGLTKLRTLDLMNCDCVTDLSPLKHSTNLEELNLCGTGITSLDSLSGLSKLSFLDLRGTDINDLSPLAGKDFTSGLILDDKTNYINRPKGKRDSVG